MSWPHQGPWMLYAWWVMGPSTCLIWTRFPPTRQDHQRAVFIFGFFFPIAYVAIYQPNTFDFLNLAWSMIPVTEEKPVSVLIQKWRLCLFDDSVETGCSQRRQPQATEVGPSGQQTQTGPPRSAGDGGYPASLMYRVQLARYLHITILGFGGWLAVAATLALATTFSQSPVLSWRC